MEISPRALYANDNCYQRNYICNFNILQHSEVVYVCYWIYSSRRFLKPVDVQLQHCARLSSDEDCSQMQFIRAWWDQKQLPYTFSIKDVVFSPKTNDHSWNAQWLQSSIIIMFNSSLVEPTEYVSIMSMQYLGGS